MVFFPDRIEGKIKAAESTAPGSMNNAKARRIKTPARNPNRMYVVLKFIVKTSNSN
jgi:hypothetical protein